MNDGSTARRIQMRNKSTVLGTLLLAAGCSVDVGSPRIEISEPNQLGATEIETSRVTSESGTRFELRAFDAGGTLVGSVERRTGIIDDMLDFSPGTDLLGSDIRLFAAGEA